MGERTVVVLGGGVGGAVVARALRRRVPGGDRVILVDREPTHRFLPSALWLMTGARSPGQITRDLRRLERRGIEVLLADVREVDVAGRRLGADALHVGFDRLVVAAGADLAPDAMPGFEEAAHSLYTFEGSLAAGRALRAFAGGRIVILVSSMPFKCPAAPYEAALLAEAMLRELGVRDLSTIDIYTPEPLPMPTAGPQVGEALKAVLAERGIGFHPEVAAVSIDAERRGVTLADGGFVPFDLLLGVPPHRPPEVVRESGLSGETGYVPVDAQTLATTVEGIFAIGDVTTIPIAGGKSLPKAGVFAHHQAKVVARRIADELAGRKPTAEFDGSGSCFVATGDGKAAYASGRFYGGFPPPIRFHAPGRLWHLGKKVFERYWLGPWFW